MIMRLVRCRYWKCAPTSSVHIQCGHNRLLRHASNTLKPIITITGLAGIDHRILDHHRDRVPVACIPALLFRNGRDIPIIASYLLLLSMLFVGSIWPATCYTTTSTRGCSIAPSRRHRDDGEHDPMLSRILDSDAFHSFSRQPLVVVAALLAALFVLAALLAPWVAPHNPFDLSTVSLLDAKSPPVWQEGGSWTYPLGTDHQGRDILSAIIYGTRVSLLVALPSTLIAMTIGVTLGLLAGYAGGSVDSALMRLADIQLSFPAILVALLIDGIARVLAPKSLHD
jgi:hypothetical protein